MNEQLILNEENFERLTVYMTHYKQLVEDKKILEAYEKRKQDEVIPEEEDVTLNLIGMTFAQLVEDQKKVIEKGYERLEQLESYFTKHNFNIRELVTKHNKPFNRL